MADVKWLLSGCCFFLFVCVPLQKDSSAISTNHCYAQQLLNLLFLLAFGSVFLEREKGDSARWSLGRVIKAADGKDLPSSRSRFSWKVEIQDVCLSQARYVYGFKCPAALDNIQL